LKLYVMRHGPAEDHAESGLDADRPLSAPGRDRVRTVARALHDGGEEPWAIVTSPLVRAVQTAEIVALTTQLGDRNGTVEVRRGIAPGGDAVRLVHQLVAEGRKRVMVVGHEPDLSGLVSSMLGGFGRGFDKAMVVGLHVPSEGGHPKLRFVLEPKTLRWDPDPRAEPR
jgi:phosphohistidine phosphatase